VSQATRHAVHTALPRLRSVSDPLSGFFALRREVLDGVDLDVDGFKILLELLAWGRWDTVVEVPFVFAPRAAGTSKASLGTGARFARQLLRLACTARRPPALAPAPGVPVVVR
jgi:dolichol-phosphate mannosyltransferase